MLGGVGICLPSFFRDFVWSFFWMAFFLALWSLWLFFFSQSLFSLNTNYPYRKKNKIYIYSYENNDSVLNNKLELSYKYHYLGYFDVNQFYAMDLEQGFRHCFKNASENGIPIHFKFCTKHEKSGISDSYILGEYNSIPPKHYGIQ